MEAERIVARASGRLQMTHNPTRLALVAALAALLFAGCGGEGSSSTDGTTSTAERRARLVPARLAQPKGCFITVYLSDIVTPAQTRHVRLLLLSSQRIVTVSFVSKELSLRRLEQTQPELVASMYVNLFPDRFEVVPGTSIDVFAIITEFAAGVDGVTNARASRGCSQP